MNTDLPDRRADAPLVAVWLAIALAIAPLASADTPTGHSNEQETVLTTNLVRVPVHIFRRAERLCKWMNERYPQNMRPPNSPNLIFLYRTTPTAHREANTKPAYYDCDTMIWRLAATASEPKLRECTSNWHAACESEADFAIYYGIPPATTAASCTFIRKLEPWYAKVADQAHWDVILQSNILSGYVGVCGTALHMTSEEAKQITDLIISRVSLVRLQTWFDGRPIEHSTRTLLRIDDDLITDNGMLVATPTTRAQVRAYAKIAFVSFIAGAIETAHKHPVALRDSFEDRLARFAITLDDVVAGRSAKVSLGAPLAALTEPPGTAMPIVPGKVMRLAEELCGWAQARYPRLSRIADGSRLQFLHRGSEPALYDCGSELWGPLNGAWIDGSWTTTASFWDCVAGGETCPTNQVGFAYRSYLAESKPVVCNGIVLLDRKQNGKTQLRSATSLRSTVVHEYSIHCGLNDHIATFDRNRFLNIVAARVTYPHLRTWFSTYEIERFYRESLHGGQDKLPLDGHLPIPGLYDGPNYPVQMYVEEAFAHLVDDYLVTHEREHLTRNGPVENELRLTDVAEILDKIVQDTKGPEALRTVLDEIDPPTEAPPHWLEGVWYGARAPEDFYRWEEIYVARVDPDGYVHGLMCVEGFLMAMTPEGPYTMRETPDGMTEYVGGMRYRYTRKGEPHATELAAWRRRDDWPVGQEERWTLHRTEEAQCATHATWIAVLGISDPESDTQ